ncbi:MAG: hypothetical protein QXJ02_04505 [Candidatus Bathyarchaeia archaeon]
MKLLWLAIAVLIIIIAIPAAAILAIWLPAQAQYNRLFGGHVTMALDQATFEGIEDQINVIWAQMNSTFSGYDFNTTYCSPWYWEQNYENSLAAQQDYFRQLIRRIDSYQAAYAQMSQNNTNPILVEDWYDKSINNLRSEMRREGGLDWAIRGAWFLNYAPLAYWLTWWLVPLEFGLFIILIALFVSMAVKHGWTRNRY